MPEPNELVQALSQDSLFQQWQQQHPEGYLSHLFCVLAPEPQNWELGHYDPATQLITVFAQHENGFEIKPADAVFKEEHNIVEKLEINKVQIPASRALEQFAQKKEEYFPKEVLGNGFLVLQTLHQKICWNFTFITNTVRFVNLKINAETGAVESSETIDLVQSRK
ncbi:hypothetical protein HYX14_05635 [Candidatus Woesearchaeota archaeon]|nr:hypothetical protein [Candidatus Woesearchaeota archaeon]